MLLFYTFFHFKRRFLFRIFCFTPLNIVIKGNVTDISIKTHTKCANLNVHRCIKGASLSHVKVPLGRWNIHNYKETMLKIKYATEDNCGVFYKNTTQIQKKNELDYDNEYIYMMGYESVHE